MLLGELFNKKVFLEEQIKDIKLYLSGITNIDSNYKEILTSLDEYVWEYETCCNVINENIVKINVNMFDNKSTNLTKLIVLQKTLSEKIETLSNLIRNKCYDSTIVIVLIKQKNEYLKEYKYITAIVNKVIWGSESDN